MQILIIGGFLGSGKTTIIKSLLKALDSQGQTVALIENEIGEVGIDDTVLSTGDLVVKPLFGGCVCCEISGNLVVTIQSIQSELNPNWVIVEMTGLALMDSIRETIVKYGGEGLTTHTVSVLDVERWEVLHLALSQVLEHQIEGADVVILNKENTPELEQEASDYIMDIAPQAKQIRYSLDESPEQIWNALSSSLGIKQTEVA